MNQDDAKRSILARRARFVAAALAAAATAASAGSACNPTVCLSPPYDPDSGRRTDVSDGSAEDAGTNDDGG